MRIPTRSAALALGLFALGCTSSTSGPGPAEATTTGATTTGAGGATTTGTGGATTTGAGGANVGGATTGTGGATTSAGGAGGATTGAGGAGGSATTGAGGGLACADVATSTLTGVAIRVTSADCTFTLAEAAAGITITYEVEVAADVADVTPAQQDAGHCGGPGDSGLILFEQLGGGGQSYCLCDVGLCGGIKIPPRTIAQGTYPATFSWDGRNWSGPSDWNAPKGAPFPAGDYVLDLSALGEVAGAPFEVRTTVPIRIVP